MKKWLEKIKPNSKIAKIFVIANGVALILWLVTSSLLQIFVKSVLDLPNWYYWIIPLVFWLIVINMLTWNFWNRFFSKNKNKLLDKYNKENEFDGWLTYHDWNQKKVMSVFDQKNKTLLSKSSAIILETLAVNSDDVDYKNKKIRNSRENKYSSYKPEKIEKGENDKIYFRRSEEEHSVIVFGIPGTGKTSFLLIPSICANIISEDKPSMTIIDVKGELYDNTAALAKENGYKIIKINCVDPFDSHRINPLMSIIDYWQNLIDVKRFKIEMDLEEYFVYDEYFETKGNENTFKSTKKEIVKNLEKFEFNDIDRFNDMKDDEPVYVIGRVVFNDQKTIKENLNRWYSFYSEKSDRELDSACELVMADFYKNSGNDKFWAESAKLLLKTILNLLRFQYWCGLIKRESFNFYYACNLLKSITVKAWEIYLKEIRNTEIFIYDEIESDPEWVKMINSSKKQFIPDSKTFESIQMTAYTSIDDFSKFWIGQLTSKNEVDLNTIFKEPTIIYLIFSESEKNRSKFCCYILDLIWRLVEDTARKYPRNKLPKNLYMYNDEFGNISFLKSAEPSVTLGRGYGVRSTFFIQDYAQIEKIYGKESANIIFNSCKTRIFLGTKNEDTIKKFTENFGTIKKMRASISSSEKKDSNSVSSSYEEKTIVHKNTLLNLPSGKAVIWVENLKPFLTQLEKPWLFDFFSFQKHPKLDDVNPGDIINDFHENSEHYLISNLEKIDEDEKKKNEFNRYSNHNYNSVLNNDYDDDLGFDSRDDEDNDVAIASYLTNKRSASPRNFFKKRPFNPSARKFGDNAYEHMDKNKNEFKKTKSDKFVNNNNVSKEKHSKDLKEIDGVRNTQSTDNIKNNENNKNQSKDVPINNAQSNLIGGSKINKSFVKPSSNSGEIPKEKNVSDKKFDMSNISKAINSYNSGNKKLEKLNNFLELEKTGE